MGVQNHHHSFFILFFPIIMRRLGQRPAGGQPEPAGGQPAPVPGDLQPARRAEPAAAGLLRAAAGHRAGAAPGDRGRRVEGGVLRTCAPSEDVRVAAILTTLLVHTCVH